MSPLLLYIKKRLSKLLDNYSEAEDRNKELYITYMVIRAFAIKHTVNAAQYFNINAADVR